MCCFTKLFLFVVNICIFVVGVIVVTLSSIVIHRGTEFEVFLFDGAMGVPVAILIFGLFVTTLGFLGCCGALKENKCMLYTYATIVLVLLIGEITVSILIMLHPDKAKEMVVDNMEEIFDDYSNNPDPVDNIQQNLECCGVGNFTYWGNNIPKSCCKNPSPSCSNNIDMIYTRGCDEALFEEFQALTVTLGVFGLILALLQMLSIIGACGMAKSST